MSERERPGPELEGRPDPGSSDPDHRIEAIADRYEQQLRSGTAPDREGLVSAHPELARRLGDRLSVIEILHGATKEAGTLQAEPEGRPVSVGPYKILRVLGEGGMAVVYLAEQSEPVRRKVALKLMKPGLDTEDAIARFESERQALALMDHPAIAKIFDAGTTEMGRPCFVMEHVPGIPITTYCDDHRLTTTERLDLFLQVCDAVQHAHQKGVIHRDLKPTNILVTASNGTGAAKIIDFEIAKALGGKLTERTVHTEHGRMLGTLEYMSPEQAAGASDEVDTRTDIYSLGVVLYELLVGVRPLDTAELRDASLDEIRRQIRETEPVKPSTHASILATTKREVADRRKTDATRHARLLRGDLDWITMKALEKDRMRRYATASELGADIQRHLHDEVVLAGPPSATYRLKKFVRKHRGSVAAVSAAGAALVLGLAGTTAMYLRAEGERAEAVEAREREAEQREAALASAAEAQEQRDAAKIEADNFEAIYDFLDAILSSVDPGDDGRDAKVADVLDRASREIETDLSVPPKVETALRSTIGNTYVALGLYDEAEPHLRLALEIREEVLGENHQDTLAAMNNFARLLKYQGKLDAAEPLYESAVALQRVLLGDDHANTLASIHNLAALLRKRGKFAEAEPWCREAFEGFRRLYGDEDPQTLTSMNNLALSLHGQGKSAEAKLIFRQAIEIGDASLAEGHPVTLTSRHNFAVLLGDLREYAEAEQLQRKVLPILRRDWGEDHPKTLKSFGDLAWLCLRQGKLEEAEELYREYVEIVRRKRGETHWDTLHAMDNLANSLQKQEKYSDAAEVLKEVAETARRSWPEGDPARARFQSHYGAILVRLERYEEAERVLLEALAGAGGGEGDRSKHRVGGRIVHVIIHLYTTWGKPEEAEEYRRLFKSSADAVEREQPEESRTPVPK